MRVAEDGGRIGIRVDICTRVCQVMPGARLIDTLHLAVKVDRGSTALNGPALQVPVRTLLLTGFETTRSRGLVLAASKQKLIALFLMMLARVSACEQPREEKNGDRETHVETNTRI